MDREDLTVRLSHALLDVGASDCELAAEIFDELARRYAEPHRAYHTLAHVEACLVWLDAYRDQAEHPAEVELALWFHDAVYDAERHDNEAQSAALASARLTVAGVPEPVVQRIAELIEATQRHQATAGDAALICAIDLSILAVSRQEFEAYEKCVRQEYGHVPDAAFRAGRARFLRALLERPVLYANDALRERFEAAARRNIERALAEAGGRP